MGDLIAQVGFATVCVGAFGLVLALASHVTLWLSGGSGEPRDLAKPLAQKNPYVASLRMSGALLRPGCVAVCIGAIIFLVGAAIR